MADPLFREAEIPHFDRGSLVLPVSAWLMLLRLLWLAGFSQNGEPLVAARDRARSAAARAHRIGYGAPECVVGWPWCNELPDHAGIACERLARAGKPGSGFWEFAIYEYAVPKS